MLMQGQRQQETERLRKREEEEEEERVGLYNRLPYYFYCTLELPPLTGDLSHIHGAPEPHIHARLHTGDGKWPSEERRRMAGTRTQYGARRHIMRASDASSEVKRLVAAAAAALH
ncbi:hypothetical protein JOB18_038885 [Solea senegalensis]|uniref:Uncharacterized protein n=1 Tax=Solea senegalensis TaxID=28829 RepID=A0AAV6PI42_SOLSE|nr:hypothetical protein JOB18_038885 [Solea senegalensis]